jgi:hypothetical protein
VAKFLFKGLVIKKVKDAISLPLTPFTELEPINQQCPREQQQKYNSDDNKDDIT